jgi:membrane-associated protease RseP (regulator of RpoE activity)
MGMKVANISPALAENCGSMRGRRRGGAGVADGSLAQNLGFQKGDVIAAVNNEKIARTRDLERDRQGIDAPLGDHAGARRADVSVPVRRMSTAAETRPSLFEAAGLEHDAPRPLADRLRRPSSPKWSGRTICSGPTARSPACWRRARSAR